MKHFLVLSVAMLGLYGHVSTSNASENSADLSAAPTGWKTTAPRDEIRPAFGFEPGGGADGKGCFIIHGDGREGLDGAWTKTFPVVGGEHYRFSALYQAKSVAVPRRSIVVKLDWQDSRGAGVPLDEP